MLGLAPTVREGVPVSVLAAVLLGVSVPLVLAVLEAVPVWVPVGGIVFVVVE